MWTCQIFNVKKFTQKNNEFISTELSKQTYFIPSRSKSLIILRLKRQFASETVLTQNWNSTSIQRELSKNKSNQVTVN